MGKNSLSLCIYSKSFFLAFDGVIWIHIPLLKNEANIEALSELVDRGWIRSWLVW